MIRLKFTWLNCCCICLLLPLFCLLEAVPFGKNNWMREDLLCNVGDDHECVCNRSIGNLDTQYSPCHEFLQVGRMDVLNMVLRDVNLNARLYTNETYEQYLRRRIAQILSQYCETMPEDCPGTLAEIRGHPRKASASIYELDERTVSVIEDGPVFSRGNIVILRVNYPPGKERTELSLVVLMMANMVGINPAAVLNPTTVKYILSAQMAPLSRVLGGIRIEQFGVDTFLKPVSSADNTTLLILITIICLLITVSCTVAIAKVIYDVSRARKLRRQNKETPTESRGTRNYGTCTEKLFSNNSNNVEVPNGRAKSVCSQGSNGSSRRKREMKLTKCSNEMGKVVIEEEKAAVAGNEEEASPRGAYQNIFICDHSQLPKEYGDEEFEMEMRRGNKQSLNVLPNRSPFSSDDDTSFQFPDRSNTGDKRFSFSDNIPCVILEDGNGIDEKDKEEIEEEQMPPQYDMRQKSGSGGGGGFLTMANEAMERPHSRQGGHPFDRPLSRRGSREEKQDEGEEETYNDTREDTPVPLGDDQVLAVVKPLNDLLRNKNKKKVDKKLLLLTNECSESEEEAENSEEEQQLYKPLKSEEKPIKKRAKERGKGGQSSSGSDNEAKNEDSEMLERHQYERLLEESPIPPQMMQTPKIILND